MEEFPLDIGSACTPASGPGATKGTTHCLSACFPAWVYGEAACLLVCVTRSLDHMHEPCVASIPKNSAIPEITPSTWKKKNPPNSYFLVQKDRWEQVGTKVGIQVQKIFRQVKVCGKAVVCHSVQRYTYWPRPGLPPNACGNLQFYLSPSFAWAYFPWLLVLSHGHGHGLVSDLWCPHSLFSES